jgi:signal peptidase I
MAKRRSPTTQPAGAADVLGLTRPLRATRRYLRTLASSVLRPRAFAEARDHRRFLPPLRFYVTSMTALYVTVLIPYPQDPISLFELPKHVQLALTPVKYVPLSAPLGAGLFLVAAAILPFLLFRVFGVKVALARLLAAYADLTAGPGLLVGLVGLAAITAAPLFIPLDPEPRGLELVGHALFFVIWLTLLWIYYVPTLKRATGKAAWICIAVLVVSGILSGVLTDHVIKRFLVQAYRIPSSSMAPTLIPGDLILANKLVPTFRGVHRGEIIVFRYPPDPKRSFAKRVIAGPGETVHVRDQEVYLNGKHLDEPYVKSEPRPSLGRSPFCGFAYGCEPTMIPANSYFVMGDNRHNSQDSRYWGPVPGHLVLGVVYFRYFPVWRAAAIGSPDEARPTASR